MRSQLSLLSLTLLTSLANAVSAQIQSTPCNVAWGAPPPIMAGTSDAEYQVLRLLTSSDDVGLLIEGTLPDARYMSVTTYTPDGTGFHSLFDADLRPDFNSGAWRAVIVPNVTAAGSLTDPKVFRVSAATEPRIATAGAVMVVRTYLRVNKDAAPLPDPKISAFNVSTGKPIDCPRLDTNARFPIQFVQTALSQYVLVPQLTPNLLDVYRTSQDHYYENMEAAYLVTNVEFPSDTNVAVFSFQAPTVSTNYSVRFPDDSWARSNARYFSLSLIDYTGVSLATIRDNQFAPTRDITTPEGQVIPNVATIAIGLKGSQAEAFAKSNGITFAGLDAIPTSRRFLTGFREIGANEFPGSFEKVEICTDRRGNPAQCDARCYVKQFAPRGVVCSQADFLANKCNVSLTTTAGCPQ
ncbi:hypothetical protein HK102_000063 [Quaeritorhiza haematococci]|nr:hypothetical protein HK102_000063 [Quaeritorhiza haematococci]